MNNKHKGSKFMMSYMPLSHMGTMNYQTHYTTHLKKTCNLNFNKTIKNYKSTTLGNKSILYDMIH